MKHRLSHDRRRLQSPLLPGDVVVVVSTVWVRPEPVPLARHDVSQFQPVVFPKRDLALVLAAGGFEPSHYKREAEWARWYAFINQRGAFGWHVVELGNPTAKFKVALSVLSGSCEVG